MQDIFWSCTLVGRLLLSIDKRDHRLHLQLLHRQTICRIIVPSHKLGQYALHRCPVQGFVYSSIADFSARRMTGEHSLCKSTIVNMPCSAKLSLALALTVVLTAAQLLGVAGKAKDAYSHSYSLRQ